MSSMLLVMSGAIQVLRNADGGVQFSGEKRYESVRSNVISVTTGGWGPISRKNALRNTLMGPYESLPLVPLKKCFKKM